MKKSALKELSYLCVVLASMGVGACSSVAPEAYSEPSLSYEHVQVVNVPVSHIEFINRYNAPTGQQNDVSFRTTNDPVSVLQRWVNNRFKAAGVNDVMRVYVDEASLTERDLPVKQGVMNMFDVQPSQEYKTRVLLRVEFLDNANMPKASYTIRADRQVTVANNATLVEKDRARFGMIEKLMTNVDAEMQKIMTNYSNDYPSAAFMDQSTQDFGPLDFGTGEPVYSNTAPMPLIEPVEIQDVTPQ